MQTTTSFVVLFAALLLTTPVLAAEKSNKQLYNEACAACHGSDGKGRAYEDVALDVLPPDFTDCEFAEREPDPDWYAVIHEGGPVRAFDRMMPAFGDALTKEEIYGILEYVRTFCADKRWPRGEFNVPQAMYTGKAFPEDEAIFKVLHDTDDSRKTELRLTYEKRFGPVDMFEIRLPITTLDNVGTGRSSGIGDILVGYKRVIHHDLDKGNIVSIGTEVLLPTGDDDEGLGLGTTLLEPFVNYGKLLPSDMFLQMQLIGFIPTDSSVNDVISLRTAFGKTYTTGGEFGRAWSPMIELLARHDIDLNRTELDLVPQVQVALNVRQHVLLNIAARIPASETTDRDLQLGIYLVWDWFDGGFFDGW